MQVKQLTFFARYNLLLLALCATLTAHQKIDIITQISNQEKYVIGTRFGAGFFASFNIVLNHISWCQDNNKIPVVYWDYQSPYSSHYRHQKPNDDNVWESYFEPISNLAYEERDAVHNHDLGEKYSLGYLVLDSSRRNQAYQLIQKYIKIKPHIQKKINHFYQQSMVGKKTIGIHLRGTDKGYEEPLVDPQEIVRKALALADSDTQFLIASDDQMLFNKMLFLLQGHKVIFYKCYRSINGHPVHQPYNRSELVVNTAVNAPSYAQLGEDVLIEVSLLAKCDLLVHSLSNVSTAALYFNPTMQHILVQNQ